MRVNYEPQQRYNVFLYSFLKQCSYVILNDRLALKYESVTMTQYSRRYLFSAAEKLSAFQKQLKLEPENGAWHWIVVLFAWLSVFSHVLSAAASFILSFCDVFISSSYLHVYLQAVVYRKWFKISQGAQGVLTSIINMSGCLAASLTSLQMLNVSRWIWNTLIDCWCQCCAAEDSPLLLDCLTLIVMLINFIFSNHKVTSDAQRS